MNLYTIIKEVRAFAQAKGLNVVFEQECECPRTDGHVMYVPMPQTDWKVKEEIKWRHSVLHEAGHNDPRARDCFELARELKLDMRSFMGFCVNLIDDNRNEKFDCDIMDGKRRIMDKGNKYCRQGLIDQGFYKPHEDEKMSILQTLSLWDTQERMSWLPSMGHIFTQMEAQASEQQIEWLDKLQAYTPRLASLRYAVEEWELLQDVLKNVFGWTDAQLEQEKKQCTGKEQGQGEGGSGEEGAGKGSKGKQAEAGAGEDGEGERVGGRVKYADLMVHKHDTSSESGGVSYLPLTIDYDDADYRHGASFEIDASPHVYHYQRGENPTPLGPNRYTELVNDGFSTYSFASKLKRLLQVKAQSLEVHGLKKGKFDRKNIHRVTMTGAGGYGERVFKETIDSHILDRAVSIVVDCSGSMGGEKMVCAIRSAVLINESLGKLNVPFEVMGFTDDGNNAHFPIFKEYGKKATSKSIIAHMTNWAHHMMSGNADGEALLFAESRLLTRPEKGKLMVVLSDGQPASSRGDCYSHTVDVAKRIEHDKQVSIVGIGIEDSTVSNIYRNHKVVRDSSQLETTLIDLLRNYIIR